MKICSTFGHRDLCYDANFEEKLKSEIIKCIVERGFDTFYLGHNGVFDRLCAVILRNLKLDFPHIKRVVVLAYLNQKFELDKDYYDESIFPPIESVPLKYAILKRNEWIVNSSEYIIFCVKHSWGGASKAMEYAKKKRKKFINLANLID